MSLGYISKLFRIYITFDMNDLKVILTAEIISVFSVKRIVIDYLGQIYI